MDSSPSAGVGHHVPGVDIAGITARCSMLDIMCYSANIVGGASVLGRQVTFCSDDSGSECKVIARSNGWFKMNNDCNKLRAERER